MENGLHLMKFTIGTSDPDDLSFADLYWLSCSLALVSLLSNCSALRHLLENALKIMLSL